MLLEWYWVGLGEKMQFFATSNTISNGDTKPEGGPSAYRYDTVQCNYYFQQNFRPTDIVEGIQQPAMDLTPQQCAKEPNRANLT